MSPKICFLYTSTNGVHHTDNNVSSKNLYQFARLIAFHYSIGTMNGSKYNETKKATIILKPNAINFDKESINIHKITMDMANKKGIPSAHAITQLKTDLVDVNIIVSYNVPFHLKAIQVECFRTGISINFSKYKLVECSNMKPNNSDFSFLAQKYKLTTDNLGLIISVFLTESSTCNTNTSKPIKNTDDCDFVD